MAPFEALYGRKCRTLLYWSERGENQLFGPELIKEAERQVQVVRENLKVAQSRQKMMRTSLLCIQCKDRLLEHVRDSWISRYVLTLSIVFRTYAWFHACVID
jgi:hypothetical protein